VASLPPIKQIRAEDVLKSDGSLDAERFIGILNQFLLATYTALDKQLDISNLRIQEKTFEFTTVDPIEKSFPLYCDLDGIQTVRGAIVISAMDTSTTEGTFVDGVTAHVLPTGKGQAQIKYLSGLDVKKPYRVTIWLIG
jgi:hypothetical protein